MTISKEKYNEIRGLITTDPDKFIEELKMLDPGKDGLPLVVLTKWYKKEKSKYPFTEYPQLEQILEDTLGPRTSGETITHNKILESFKGDSGMQMVVDEFAEYLRDQMLAWGFTLLKDYNLKLEPR